MTGIARVETTQQVHYLRKTINFNDANVGTGVVIGTVPGPTANRVDGAMILDIRCRINTVFNAATTNVITVGITPGGSELVIGGSFTPGTLGGYSAPILLAGSRLFLVDTDLYVTYTQTGTAATTGQATLVVEYVPNADQ